MVPEAYLGRNAHYYCLVNEAILREMLTLMALHFPPNVILNRERGNIIPSRGISAFRHDRNRILAASPAFQRNQLPTQKNEI